MEELYQYIILLSKSLIAIILYRLLRSKYNDIGELFFVLSSKLFYAFIAIAIVLVFLNSFKNNNMPNSLYVIDFIDFIIVCQVATILKVHKHKKTN